MDQNLARVMEWPEPRLLAKGVGGEGPVWHPGGYWLFTGSTSGQRGVHRLVPGGKPELFLSGAYLGLTLDNRGRLLMCQGRRVARLEPDDTVTTVADNWRGKKLNGPNDIVCRSDGSIYFSNMSRRSDPATWETPLAVYRVAPEGMVDKAADLDMPNGLAFSPDERILYVNNSGVQGPHGDYQQHGMIAIMRERMGVWAFDVRTDGSLANGRWLADMTTRHGEPTFEIPSIDDGVPDGMRVDVEGRVYSAGPGGIWVFEPSGKHLGTIRLPAFATNLAFGGPDYRTLLLTTRAGVYELRMKVQGVVLPGARALMGNG